MEAINNITDKLCTPMPKDQMEARIYFPKAVMVRDKSMFPQK